MPFDNASGPLFDGRAEKALAEGVNAIRRDVAREGARLASSNLAGSIRSPRTGRAERAVTIVDHSVVMISGKYAMPVVVEHSATDAVVVTSLASYGPWLEGTGSRNYTTRFKGYHSFSLAGDELLTTAGDIADIAVRPYVEAMNI